MIADAVLTVVSSMAPASCRAVAAALLAILSMEPPGPCSAIDGDTLRCGSERVRLLGIDAPELAGHCRRGRKCVPGDPLASRASLAGALDGPVELQREGFDRWGRTLAMAEVGGEDLACRQMASGQARYVRRYDRVGAVARRCGLIK